MTDLHQTDWLGTNPLFYNTITKKTSLNINDVIDYANFEWNAEGLNNYLKFGYSILGNTPIKNVHFTTHDTSFSFNEFKISPLDDKTENWSNKTTQADEVISLLSAEINNWTNHCNDKIVIPTSGGYDSRLLNLLIKDKSKIKAYTYGVSKHQENSFEVVYAKELCKKLHINWKHIELGSFHKYFDKWHEIFGVSTHAHGMYHLEFFDKISNDLENKPQHLLSGIIGDAWAGRVNIKKITKWDEVNNIAYSHGISIQENICKLKTDNESLKLYYEKNSEKLKDKFWITIEAMRFKMMLLRYLFEIPKQFQLTPWSPFTNQDTAMAIHCLPDFEKENRNWQRKLFKQHDILIEDHNLIFSKANHLDLSGLKNIPPKPLNSKLLSEIIDINYCNWVNTNMLHPNLHSKLMGILSQKRGVKGALKILNISNKQLTAYYAYLVLKPLEQTIIKRNNN